MTKARDLSQTPNASLGFKNRIINGAMMIDQRNNGASITGNDYTFPVDRFLISTSQGSKLTAQRNAGSVTPPAGFINYLGITSSATTSVGASDYFLFSQIIEGLNCADLGWGTASAAPVTLSFWVRSSLTGTFGGSIRNSPDNRSYPFSYTISSANTWEQKAVTIAGDTSGTWLTTNGVGIKVSFGLGVGSTLSGTTGSWSGSTLFSATGATSVVGTNGATFYITGVQLEKGSTATSFDYRPFGTELALAQRYGFSIFGTATGRGSYAAVGFGTARTSTASNIFIRPPVPLRIAAPSVTVSGSFSVAYGSYLSASVSSIALNQGSDSALSFLVGHASGPSGGVPVIVESNNSTTTSVFVGAEL